MQSIMSVDIETYSDVDLGKAGLYKYVESPHFRILLIGYAIDDGDVKVLDLTKNPDMMEFIRALSDPEVIKTAFNAQFETTCLEKWSGIQLQREQWVCTQALSATLGLPRSLADVAYALSLKEKKNEEGKHLIRYFSIPNRDGYQNQPEDDPTRWSQFIMYNAQDVLVERELRRKMNDYCIPPKERRAWEMDQRINKRGVKVDMELVDKAIRIATHHVKGLMDKARVVTGLANPNSITQLKEYLGYESLTKKDIAEKMKTATEDEKRILVIRQELGKTSVAKYEAIKRCVCSDDRVRGLFQFYGANRTGRWSGRLVQLQNLPRNTIDTLDKAREMLRLEDTAAIEAEYGSVANVLSELIRTVFIPEKNKVFVVADFNAIEARVLAWLANEEWRMEVFNSGGKIYETSAEKMFNLPAGSVQKGDPARQKGKVAELALGYGGGVAALVRMGALDMGLSESELQPLVTAWREANPNIVNYWKKMHTAALNTVRFKIANHMPQIMLDMSGQLLHLTLPSGRALRYFRPKVVINRFGTESLSYQSNDAGKWDRVESYGAKLVENTVQAIARDCLMEAMLQIEQRYPDIVMHVHDEVVVEVPTEQAKQALRYIEQVMSTSPEWAPDLKLKADGYITPYYKK